MSKSSPQTRSTATDRDARRPAEGVGPLAPYRVLDLSNELGQLAGRMLADLGADVIKVEPPGGDASRWIGPFYHDEPDPERSLHWWTFNSSKRGITLDVGNAQGRDLFLELVRNADFVLETYAPGMLAELGLGYERLAEANPRIVLTSITPFGQEGPYAGWKATDLIGAAMGGLMWLCGDPEQPPLRPTVSQAYAQASVQAVVGTLTANFHRTRTGEGQHVDQSMQEAVTFTQDNATTTWDLSGLNNGRPGNGRMVNGQISGRYIYEAADGYVAAVSYGGLYGPGSRLVVEWLDSYGMADDLTEPEWQEKLGDMTGFRPGFNGAESEHLIDVLTAFCKTLPRAQLVEEAQAIGAGWAVVNSPKDLAENEHLLARDFWQEVRHPELNESFRYPGPWARLSETPLRAPQRAPRIGEHNDEVYFGLLQLDPERFRELSEAGVI